ncbi:MAG: alkaline phosphatase family protein [Acidobacteriaceae bacterium]
MKRSWKILFLAVMASLVAMPMGMHAQSQTSQMTATAQKFPSKIKYVWIILMENHNWTGNNAGAAFGDPDIKGSSLAPYINGWLLHHAAHAERYYNPPGNHPSAPNYLWLAAGTNFGDLFDDLPSVYDITSHKHIERLLTNAGISWKSYVEQDFGNPEFDDCPLGWNEVDPNHVPAVNFADDTNNFDPQSEFCIQHVVPYSEMATDIADHKVAHYNFISPNVCHDGHEGVSPCASDEPADNTLRGDQWLKENVRLITNSPEYKKAGVLFILWDEAEDSGSFSDGPIGMFILSPFAKGGGNRDYQNYIHYDHSSMLKTMEEIFGLQPLLGAAADPATKDLGDFFDISTLKK